VTISGLDSVAATVMARGRRVRLLPGVLAVLIRLWKLDNDPYPIEGLRTQREDAARKAPDDDRVWLGRANLAIRTGDTSRRPHGSMPAEGCGRPIRRSHAPGSIGRWRRIGSTKSSEPCRS
jgi:hypothetical protein